jgi:adenosylcobinamide-GDP ribazoletransferase
MRGLVAALRFLTLAPIPGKYGMQARDLSASVAWFPVVGAIIGIGAMVVAELATLTGSQVLAAALLTVLLPVFSGGLHVDGLADTFDGFLSSRLRSRTLEIMKDSRIGVMGATAVFCVLLVKFAAFASLTLGDLAKAAFIVPIAGRSAIAVQMALLPYVRRSGLGSVFGDVRRIPEAVWSGVFLVFACFIAGSTPLVLAGLASLAASAGFALYSRSRIGGATGDTYGAACEIAEAVAAVFAAAVLR